MSAKALFGSLILTVLLHGGADAQTPQLEVEQFADHYLLKYQDPSHGLEWRELRVDRANELLITLDMSAAQSSPGVWRYEYAVANASESVQPVVLFSVPGDYAGSAQSPASWAHAVDALYQVTWTTSAANGIPPGAAETFTVFSNQLPSVRTARARGLSELNIAALDLPQFAADELAKLEQRNVVSLRIIAPSIPTEHTSRGQTIQIAPAAILESAIAEYRDTIRDIGDSLQRNKIIQNQDEYDRRFVGTTTGVLLQSLDLAVHAMRNQAYAEANTRIQVAIDVLNSTSTGTAWQTSVYAALRQVLTVVKSRIQ